MEEAVQDQEVVSPKKGWWEKMTGEKLSWSEKIGGVFFLVVFLFVFYVTLDANKYSAIAQVIEGDGKVGVNPTTERLDFGDLSRGTQSVRTVIVNNDTFVPFYVVTLRFGSLSGLMKVENGSFLLRKGDEQEINFTTYMPASAEIGRKYSARVFVFKVPAPFF